MAATLDFVQLDVRPFDPLTRKRYYRIKRTVNCMTYCRNMVIRHFPRWRPAAILDLIQPAGRRSAMLSADPENPTLEPNMNWIRWSIERYGHSKFSPAGCLVFGLARSSATRTAEIAEIQLAAILEISNDDISGTVRPINFMFVSRVGFSVTADRMDLLPVGPNPRGDHPPSWKISNDHISGMGYPIHFHKLESIYGGI